MLILVLALSLRIFYCLDLPLTGEEAGVALLQACGRAHDFQDELPEAIVPAGKLKAFTRISADRGVQDVVDSMRFAGMHPPFYYLLLHAMLEWAPYSSTLLRSVSLVTALLSIVYLYLLGRALFNDQVGLLAALVLAVCGYGLWMGTLVRPYSLIMFLSLCSTWQAWQLQALGAISFRRGRFYGYLFTCLLGLYTLYHFVFVFMFQMLFLFGHNCRDKKIILTLIAGGALVILCFLPWVPSLRDQMDVISGDRFYFHETPSIARFIGDFASINSVRFFHLESGRVKMAVALAFMGLFTAVSGVGLYHMVKDKSRRIFLIVFIAHLIICLGLEKIMGISSLHKIKMLFFIFPILLIFLAAGLARLPRRFHLKTAALMIFCVILLANSLAAGLVRPRLTGPYRYLENLPPAIMQNLAPDKKGLVIINTTAPKPLFAFSNTLPDDIDILLLMPPFSLERLNNLNKYDTLFLTNFYVPWQNNLITASDLETFESHLSRFNFSYARTKDSGYEPLPRTLRIYVKSR